jgi:hypothetical protein
MPRFRNVPVTRIISIHNRQDISSIKNSVQFDEMKELQNIVEDTLNYLQALKDKYIANINRTMDMQQ